MPGKPDKPDKFDPYREALVVETSTIWSDQCADLADEEKQRIEAALHQEPEKCAFLKYVRLHTGFCRQITVKPEDVERLRGA